MYVLMGILFFIIVFLCVLLWQLQRQIKEICRQLSFFKQHESNLMITRELEYGGVGELANELNELLEQYREQKRRYLEKEKMIAQTYTSLSHDIRTPLTSLDGYFQLLKETEDIEEQQRYMSIITERVAFLKLMLEDLFTFSKLKNEEYRLELTNICVNRVLKDTLFSYYEDWRKKDIAPNFEITEKLLYIEGNAEALQRVIQNIIKNVLEHGRQKITVSLFSKAEQVCLRIGNLAENSDQIDITKVFDRFYKADAARSNVSSGLGLSIAKEFVLRMNGKIQAELVKDMFWITISFPCIEQNTSSQL